MPTPIVYGVKLQGPIGTVSGDNLKIKTSVGMVDQVNIHYTNGSDTIVSDVVDNVAITLINTTNIDFINITHSSIFDLLSLYLL